jgi:hypothetical protein
MAEGNAEEEIAETGEEEKEVKKKGIPNLRYDFVPTTARDAALEYFAEGGKVRSKDLEIPKNRKTGKRQKKEFANYLWVLNNTAQPLDIIAQELATKYDYIDELDILDALREIAANGRDILIEDITHINSMTDGYTQKMMEEQEEYEKMWAEERAIHEALLDQYADISDEDYIEINNLASEYVDGLTEEEQEQILTNEKPIIYEEVIKEKPSEDEGDGSAVEAKNAAEQSLNDLKEEQKALKSELAKLKENLSKNLNANQMDLLGRGVQGSLINDKAEQQAMVDEKQKEVDRVAEEIKKAEERVVAANDAIRQESINFTQSVMRSAMEGDSMEELEDKGIIETDCK